MINITRIRIKNFRSIVDETIDFCDVNYFVGKNDSGKSNVLKALNLFFNNETDFGHPFDFSVDYSKFAKKVAKHAKEITISLDIDIPGNYIEHGVKTWTKVWRASGLHCDNINSIFASNSKGVTFIRRISYFYIPAVKSNEYFKYLLTQVYLSMAKSANNRLKDLNDKYSSELQSLTQGLSQQIHNILKMNSAIQMPDNLDVLFRDLTFSTSDKVVKEINLDQRGDGIKARHIPSILRYNQDNIERGRPKKSVSGTYIWGFEEPENGIEYLSCFDMSDELFSYKEYCQLLITTHSPVFYAKSKSENAKCFFVSKTENGESKYDCDCGPATIDEKIGFMPLISPYIEQEHSKFLEKEKELKSKLKDISHKYHEATGKLIILTEGKTDVKHIKFAFEQLTLDQNFLNRIVFYDFTNSGTLGDDLRKLLIQLSKMPNFNIIIGIFDRDKHMEEPDSGKPYKALGNNVFRINIPGLVNSERKIDDKICIEHYYTNSEIETQTDRGHLYMGQDFDELGRSLDGNYFYTNYAKNSVDPIKIIDASDKHMNKLQQNSSTITKDDFADYVINHPEEFIFDNFRKIYDVIVQIAEDGNNSQPNSTT